MEIIKRKSEGGGESEERKRRKERETEDFTRTMIKTAKTMTDDGGGRVKGIEMTTRRMTMEGKEEEDPTEKEPVAAKTRVIEEIGREAKPRRKGEGEGKKGDGKWRKKRRRRRKTVPRRTEEGARTARREGEGGRKEGVERKGRKWRKPTRRKRRKGRKKMRRRRGDEGKKNDDCERCMRK